ncbi:RNA exonuclease 1 homolog isoform X2 [Erinaceus europaeus]|uniref:RNA exonuclease 1 homolog isoform X2 n=1 Tax=Erinaceus europaeus TaxID=9365 RepID=A0ABM3WMY1_ERIEU|nr:RNA exonuclease 1 homolog isoform X2 [Erinaceus europaeus]
MLRPTGFFRAIDCPYGPGAPGGPCRRPYCHFRHRGARGPGAQPPSAGYDLYDTEPPQPPPQTDGGTPGPGLLELELVNQAIEAVRCEVEREQRRYRELLEASGQAPAPPKYSAASPERAHGRGTPEYVPGRPGGKYVLDRSRPSTDLEYDPLSNFSARLLGRAPKRPRGPQPYSPALKRPREPYAEARFSEDEDEGDGDRTPAAPGEPPADAGLRGTRETAVQCDGGDLGQPTSPGTRDPAWPKKKRRDRQEGAQKRGEEKEEEEEAPGPKGPASDRRAPLGPAAPAPPPPERKAAPEPKRRALSHAELFGDESEDEGPPAQPPETPGLSSGCSDSDSDSSPEAAAPPPRASDKRLKASPGTAPASPARSPRPAPPCPPCSPSSSSSSSSSSSGGNLAALAGEVDLEGDPMEECLRIFQEAGRAKAPDQDRSRPARQEREQRRDKGPSAPSTLLPGQKRRISHLAKRGKEEEPTRSAPAPPARPPTAQEVCYRRAEQAQRDSAHWLQAAREPPSGKPSSVHISVPGEKRRRVAHAPNPRLATALAAPRAPPAGASHPPPGPALKARTLARMASKTTTVAVPKRVAHSPSLQGLKRPVIPREFGGKVPTVVRQRYLNLFMEECLKFCASSQEAVEKALSEEKVAYDRSPSKNVYLSVAVNALKKLRGLAPGAASSSVPGKSSGRKLVSHEVVLGGRLAAKTSFSLGRPGSPRTEDLKGPALYVRLRDYLLSEEQLKEHGYPFPHPSRPGGAVLFTADEKKPKDASCRVCCRCGAEYTVSPTGRCLREEECLYHWGRLRRARVAGGWEAQYLCCAAAIGSAGCQVAKQHVQDGRKENLEGFVRTFAKELPPDAHPGVFALDCEMSYTTYGLELTRVTVVDTQLQVVYDTFVRPDNDIVDYNTRFSGVTEADLAGTSTSLRDVQAVLLSMFSADTVLIGHSLESDLLALKVIHSTVVDTAVLFPHRLGLPYKRSLRNLMADYLRQIIQDSVDGHSSSEDAIACMHLVVWKLRQDAQTRR